MGTMPEVTRREGGGFKKKNVPPCCVSAIWEEALALFWTKSTIWVYIPYMVQNNILLYMLYLVTAEIKNKENKNKLMHYDAVLQI